MKSFPSTLNESQNMYGSTKSQSYTNVFDIERLKSMNINKSVPVIQEMLKPQNINISNFNAYPATTVLGNPKDHISSNNSTNLDDTEGDIYNKRQGEKVYFENPLELPSDVLALAKDYNWVYNYRAKALAAVGEKSGQSLKVSITNTAISPSMFNPMYGVSVLGIIRNTPLLNDIEDVEIDPKTTDCSIRTLCALSKYANSPLGQARYKYADFMYCKDLGKVSNNHLITLRKFAHPVGDHIFEMTSPKYVDSAGDYSFQSESDIGRLVTWFGTDDNKLEDICKYSYHATWKELNATIQEEESDPDNPQTGIIGFLKNSVDPLYNEGVDKGQVGSHSIWGWLGSKITPATLQGVGSNNGLLRNYDNNKVYTPMNTVQSTHIYEGKLEFSQEFTLNFSYQLRAYENINPRSALLDLLGNIHEVTYRRGKFWGGSRKMIGPPQDISPFKKTSIFIDNAWDKLSGLLGSIINGGEQANNVLGVLGSIGSAGVDALKGFYAELQSGSGWPNALKGLLKNALGRPTLYAWQSLLTGEDVGLWHVTIGNPRNPIMVMGNLILTNSTVQHSGPLGIDDFPTELKVSVTLKHARPRDLTEIGRMYTKGASGIYHVLAHHDLNDFFGTASAAKTTNGTDAKKIDKPLTNEQEKLFKEKMEEAGAQNIERIEQTGGQSVGSKVSQDTLAAYKEDVKSYAHNYYSQYPNVDVSSISNPFLESDEHIKIARTNNWSDTMFSMSMQEAA